MRYQPTKRINNMMDQLYGLVRDRDRGFVIPHEAIAAILGTDPHAAHYDWCLIKLKRRLRDERGIALWNVLGVGYKLLTEEEQLRIPYASRMRWARRQCRKIRDDLECLPTDNLTVYQQVIRSHRLDQTVETERAIGQKLRQQARLERGTPTIPRRAL